MYIIIKILFLNVIYTKKMYIKLHDVDRFKFDRNGKLSLSHHRGDFLDDIHHCGHSSSHMVTDEDRQKVMI